MKPRYFAAALISTLLTASIAQAQSYPAKPIRLVVPVPPGGIVDVVGRLLAQKMTEQAGQNVIVDNRPGGLTNVGSEFVARSPGDGYTLLLQSLPMVVNPVVLPKMSYDYEKDLAPVTLLVTSPYLFVVHPSVPVKSIKDLITVAKAQPNKITYASAGNASNLHIAVELFNVLAGVKTLHIPYKGGGRDRISVTLPAGLGATRRMGLSGYAATHGALVTASAPARAKNRKYLFLNTILPPCAAIYSGLIPASCATRAYF